MKEYGVILGGLVNSEKVPPSRVINSILKELQKLYVFDYEIFRQRCFQIITESSIVENLVDAIKKAFEERDMSVYIEYGTGEIEHLGPTPGLSYGPVLTKVGRSFDTQFRLM